MVHSERNDVLMYVVAVLLFYFVYSLIRLNIHHRKYIMLHKFFFLKSNTLVLPHRHKRNLGFFCFYFCYVI